MENTEAYTNPLREWLDAASLKEKRKLAELAGTTLNKLQQHAGAYRHRDGMLRLSPPLARRVELAAQALARTGLPELLREEISPHCTGCEFAERCRRK